VAISVGRDGASVGPARPLWGRLEALRRWLSFGAKTLALFAVATYRLASRVLIFREWPQRGSKLVGFGPIEHFGSCLQLVF